MEGRCRRRREFPVDRQTIGEASHFPGRQAYRRLLSGSPHLPKGPQCRFVRRRRAGKDIPPSARGIFGIKDPLDSGRAGIDLLINSRRDLKHLAQAPRGRPCQTADQLCGGLYFGFRLDARQPADPGPRPHESGYRLDQQP